MGLAPVRYSKGAADYTIREPVCKIGMHPMELTSHSSHLPPLAKGGWGNFDAGNGSKNPPWPPFFKGGTERLRRDYPSSLFVSNR